MTMKVRRPLKVALSKKIRSYAMQSKKVKTTRKSNCFFCSCAPKKLIKLKRVPKYEADSKKEAESKEKVSSATLE